MLFLSSIVIGLALVILGYKQDRSLVGRSVFVLGLLGIFISIVIHFYENQQQKELESKINNSSPVMLKEQLDYAEVSKLNIWGSEYYPFGTIVFHSPLSDLLTPYVQQRNDHLGVDFSCTPEAINSYRKAITVNPEFPFAYLYVGECDRQARMFNWKSEIDNAKRILKITSTINGHNPDHSALLELIQSNPNY